MTVRLLDDFNDKGSMQSSFNNAMELASKIKSSKVIEIEIKDLPVGSIVAIPKHDKK